MQAFIALRDAVRERREVKKALENAQWQVRKRAWTAWKQHRSFQAAKKRLLHWATVQLAAGSLPRCFVAWLALVRRQHQNRFKVTSSFDFS